MRKITDIFAEKQKTISLELFPPKTEKGYTNLLATISHLAQLKPDYISCTYGAGGGSRDRTFDIVEHIQKSHGIPAVAHLTCVCHTKNEIRAMLKDLQRRGVCNILALRGDPPRDNPDWTPGEENFRYAGDLCTFVREHFGEYFGIGVAGFPEGHPLSKDLDTDAYYLKKKVDSGADAVITQLFFDNRDYFQYCDRLKMLGVGVRVIPGILPITNYQGLLSFCSTCKATVPDEVKAIFAPIQEDKDKTLEEGIKFAVRQCRGLLAGGSPGLHFYALNKLHPVKDILEELKIN